MYPYPTAEQFNAALPTLMQVLTGKVSIPEDVNALYVGVGYAISQSKLGTPITGALRANAINWIGLLQKILPILLQTIEAGLQG